MEHEMTTSEDDTMTELRNAIARLLEGDVLVDVSEWVGCDEDDWGQPVYVTAEAPGREFFDAVCDLQVGSVESQAEWCVEQLLKG